MAFLPREVEYNRPHASVSPETNSINVIVRPANGQTFSAGGDVIQFDLPARSFLSPSSLVLRGVITTTADTTGDTNTLLGACPGSSWIQRVETQIAGQTIESINNYNQLYNMLVNTKMSMAERFALQTEFALGGGGDAGLGSVAPTSTNGICSFQLGSQTAASNVGFAIPLGSMLANCQNFVPLGMMGAVRVSITTDQLSNFMNLSTAANVPTFSLGSLELAFDLVDFGRSFDGVVGSMADADGNINIKTSSWNMSSLSLGGLAAGSSSENIFNVRLSSIKSLIVQGGGDSATHVNGAKFDAIATAGPSGSTQLVVASQVYPQTPLAESNQALMMSELRQALGEAHGLYGTKMSIIDDNFNANKTKSAPGGTSTALQPACHFVGINTEKVSTNQLLMSGISSQLSPISVRIQNSATVGASVLTLMAMYDAIISINLPTRQVQTRV